MMGEAISPRTCAIHTERVADPDTLMWQQGLSRISPGTLYGRPWWPLNPSAVAGHRAGTIPGPCTPRRCRRPESILTAWPQIVGLVAGTILLFVIGYVVPAARGEGCRSARQHTYRMAGHRRPKDGVSFLRLCPGHPRLACSQGRRMPGRKPGMTSEGFTSFPARFLLQFSRSGTQPLIGDDLFHCVAARRTSRSGRSREIPGAGPTAAAIPSRTCCWKISLRSRSASKAKPCTVLPLFCRTGCSGTNGPSAVNPVSSVNSRSAPISRSSGRTTGLWGLSRRRRPCKPRTARRDAPAEIRGPCPAEGEKACADFVLACHVAI